MPDPNRFQLLNPEPGKHGWRIDLAKYETIRDAILHVIERDGEVTFMELTRLVREVLTEPFEGSLSWYVTSVKLDLEARGMIRRVPGSKPQRLVLV